jgi:2,5-dihydroxypyridine 5,6-dioxygenase
VKGNNAIGLGIPWWLPGGGENHPDAVVLSQSMWIDGKPVVRDGSLVPPDLARLEQALVS